MRIFLTLLAVLSLSACSSMLLGNTSSRETVSPTNTGTQASATDTAISGDIRQQFSDDAGLGEYAIGIRTRAGVVTLSGTVGSYPLRDRAVKIAQSTSGVQRVDNRIIVNTNF
jgi:osmotically-inducible protein OsmY